MAQMTFKERVLAAVRKIPKGTVSTYGEIARCAGNPHAARAVGSILKANYDSDVPCHRVVRANGTLGGYNRGIRRKQDLLAREGATLEV